MAAVTNAPKKAAAVPESVLSDRSIYYSVEILSAMVGYDDFWMFKYKNSLPCSCSTSLTHDAARNISTRQDVIDTVLRRLGTISTMSHKRSTDVILVGNSAS